MLGSEEKGKKKNINWLTPKSEILALMKSLATFPSTSESPGF